MENFEKNLDSIIKNILGEAINSKSDDASFALLKKVLLENAEKTENLKGKQKELDVAKPKGKLTAADFKKLRDMNEITFGDTEDDEVEPYGDFKTEKPNVHDMKEAKYNKNKAAAFINYLKNSMDNNMEKSLDNKKGDQIDFDFEMDMQNMDEEDTMEGNAFSGALAKARKDGKSSFEVDGKKYSVEEKVNMDEMNDKNIKSMKAKKTLKMTESEVIDMIEKIVIEQKANFQKQTSAVEPGFNKISSKNKEVNSDHVKDVMKKMKDYLKTGSDGEYEMNPQNFPVGNGEMKETPKKAYKPSDAVDEYVDAFAYPGQTNLVYDEIKPNDEWIEANLVGSSKTGNAQVDDDGNALGNVVPTKTGEKFYKNFKDNLYGAEQMNASYKRYPQPVDQAGEGTEDGALALKKGAAKAQKVLNQLESTKTVKNDKILNEEFLRIKNIISYGKKTQ